MPRSTDARAKALATAERLFRTQGYAATGLAQVIAESGSPKGSFYFHFPAGKDQLACEVIDAYGARGRKLIEHISEISGDDAAAFVNTLCKAFAAEVRESKYQLGCAVQNIAAERVASDTPLDHRLRRALESWIHAAALHFIKSGLADTDALRLARVLITSLEGARTTARLQGQDDVFFDLAAFTTHALSGLPVGAVDRGSGAAIPE